MPISLADCQCSIYHTAIFLLQKADMSVGKYNIHAFAGKCVITISLRNPKSFLLLFHQLKKQKGGYYVML